MKILTLTTALVLLFCAFAVKANGQISIGGTPPTVQDPGSCGAPPVITMPAVNVVPLLAQDSIDFLVGAPFIRFGATLVLDTGMTNAGDWDTLIVDGDSMAVWRLAIASAGAKSLNLEFDDFYLPDDCLLYVYSSDTAEILGAFTSRNNKASGYFSTLPIETDTIILEYCAPIGLADTARIHLKSVIHGYRELYSSGGGLFEFNGGGSSACEINVRCEDGEEWCREERSVCFIFNGNRRLCSGVLINNVEDDFTPYVLTAYHCVVSPDSDGGGTEDIGGCQERDAIQLEKDDVENWIFVFGGVAPSCNASSGPRVMNLPSFHGAEYISGYRYTDYALVKMLETPGSEHGLYYSGWTRDYTTNRSKWVSLHHPAADYMKVSTQDGTIVVTASGVAAAWNECPMTGNSSPDHWYVNWSRGTTENGSSGAPLYDGDHRIMGQLTGNQDIDSSDMIKPGGILNDNVFCENPQSYFGRFDISWDRTGATTATSLKGWLDPNNTNPVYHDGIHVPLYLYNREISINRTFNVYNTIEIAGNLPPHLPYYDTQQDFSVEPTKRCTIKAERRITIKPGVHVKADSYFRAWIGPIDCSEGNILASGDPKVESSGSKPVVLDGGHVEAVTGVARQYRTTIYPNPFRRETMIQFTMLTPGSVSITLFDAAGNSIEHILQNIPYQVGVHELRYSAEHLPPGTYFYRFSSGDYMETRALILLK